ncbi:glutaredoxin-C8-like [Carex rostrata]
MIGNQLKLHLKPQIPIKTTDLIPDQTIKPSISISIARPFKLRYPSLCLASLNPIQTPPITPVEMALTRRIGMATVALIAFATAAFVAAPADAAKEKRAFIRSTVKGHDIVIFSKSYCPYCKRAKGVFKDLNEEPFVVELDQREDGSEIQDALLEIVGKRTVPQVFIKGKHLGGSDATVEAYESGKLKELLDPKDDL